MNEVYDLNLYKIFYICANSKSFSEAANKLNLTQPAVSYDIRLLESELNTSLFERTNSGIKLTEEGKALLYYVERANDSLISGGKVISELKNTEVLEINIGVPTHVGAYYLINYLKLFHEKYPNIKINIIDKMTNEMLKMLTKKEIDILIDTDLTDNEDENIAVVKFKDFRGIFVGNKNFKKISEKGSIKASEFARYPIILPSSNTMTRKLIDSYFRRKNTLIKPIFETNSSPIAKNIIESGIGIGWMIKEFVEEDINSGNLYEIKTEVETVKIPISFAYQKNNLNYAIKELINIFKNNI